MALAFAEAAKVKGKTLPNPAVGAVLVKAGKVVGRGGTRPAGQSHAEIVALEKAGARAKGGTLYVTLEPCSHFGRTPPCCDAVIAAGVKRVVVAIADANPLVKGRGLEAMRKACLRVEVGLMAEAAADLYEGFFFHIKHGRPKIILKIAQSLDGSINARPGEETAITCEEARAWTHALRSRVDAVVVTGKTLRADDPDLTPRLVKGAAPQAVVLSRRGPFPADAKLFAREREAETGAPKTVVAGESREGLPDWVEHVSLGGNADVTSAAVVRELLALFQARGYHSVLIEGGRAAWALFLNARMWDSLFVLTAPKLLPSGDKWAAALAQDWGKSAQFRKFTSLGNDFLTEFGRSESNG